MTLIWHRWINGSYFRILLPVCLHRWFTLKRMGLNSIRRCAPSARISSTLRTLFMSTAAFRAADRMKLIRRLHWFCLLFEKASSWKAAASIYLSSKLQPCFLRHDQFQMQYIDSSVNKQLTATVLCSLPVVFGSGTLILGLAYKLQ